MQAKVVPTLPPKHFITRNLYPFFADPLGFVAEMRKKTGPVFNVNLPFTDVMLIMDPGIGQYILQNKTGNYTKGMAYEHLKLSLGNGLVTNNDESWFTNRKLINPFFHRQALEHYLQVMEKETDKMLAMLVGEKEEVDILHILGDLTLNIVTGSIIKEEDERIVRMIRNSVIHANEFLLNRVRNPVRLPLWIPTKDNQIFNKNRKELDAAIFRLIEKRRLQPEEDMLSMLVTATDEQGNNMSDRQIRDEVITLLVAGHETTANALSWAFYLMALYPDTQNKARRAALEIESLKRWDELQNLGYVKQVIQESMRLYPAIWSINRKAIKEDVAGGYLIPEGKEVFVDIYAIHHDPTLWPEPDKFDPGRFAPDKEERIHKSHYLPFGLGPRFCIGSNFAITEMIIVLTMFLRKFEILPGKTEPVLNPLITLTAKNGIGVRLKAI